MEVVKFRGDGPLVDPLATAFYTEPPIPPAPGDTLARDAYENVTVLGDLTQDNFDRLMIAMTEWVAPEESCAYCHGDEGDFASDALYTKVVARRMIEMTRNINENWTDHVAPAGVTCATCHGGENIPSGIWFDITPVVNSMAGWGAVQNRVTSLSQSTSLPSDALQKYLVDYEPIRVHDLAPRVENAGTASVQDAERTYSLMNYFSNSLGTNCTYCHNTRALYDLDESTPQLLQAQLGIAMALEINNDYLLPLADVLPPNRLGALHQDVPKVACATCHKGQTKPLAGASVIADWPELATSGAARLRMTAGAWRGDRATPSGRQAMSVHPGRPNSPLLDRVSSPADLRRMSDGELAAVADELRAGADLGGVEDRRPSRLEPRGGRADGRDPRRLQHALRQADLGREPPVLPAQDRHRPARPDAHAAPGRGPVRLHQAQRKPVRPVRRGAFLDLDLGRPRLRRGARPRRGDRRRGGGDRRRGDLGRAWPTRR